MDKSYTPPSSPGSNVEKGDEVDYLQIEQQREDNGDQLSLYLRSERMVHMTKEERNRIRAQKQLAKDQGTSIPIVDVDPSAPPQKKLRKKKTDKGERLVAPSTAHMSPHISP
ncbi:hypothetical protein A2U01_0023068, partial [Trifolium medium]|nr:hypothetical protein [Trifolium medium]